MTHPTKEELEAMAAYLEGPHCSRPYEIKAAAMLRAMKGRPHVKPLDLSTILRHAFLSGVVAANNIPAGDPCDGPKLWTEYEPYEPGSYSRILAALEPAPKETRVTCLRYTPCVDVTWQKGTCLKRNGEILWDTWELEA